jgi:hypothetical protein
MSQPQSVMKNLLLSSLLATSLVAPMTAYAETVSVMVVNVRSEDGIYRPALRVLRGGTVTFFRTDDTEAENPLTVRTIYNQAALMAWLMEAIPATAGETFDIQIEQPPQSPSPKEEGEEPGEDCECFYCGICYDDFNVRSSLEELSPFSDDTIDMAGLTIAEQDEAQRSALYATL